LSANFGQTFDISLLCFLQEGWVRYTGGLPALQMVYHFSGGLQTRKTGNTFFKSMKKIFILGDFILILENLMKNNLSSKFPRLIYCQRSDKRIPFVRLYLRIPVL